MDEKPTILLAEDHPVNAEVAEHIIRRLGYQVDLVGDGYAVLEAVHRKYYPVVLMDLRMPRMMASRQPGAFERRFLPTGGP